MTAAEKVQALKDEIAAHRANLLSAQLRLVEFYVKCPTCRCRILPGETCECCANSARDMELSL